MIYALLDWTRRAIALTACIYNNSLHCYFDAIEKELRKYVTRPMKKDIRTYADSEAPDQPAHPQSLIEELYCAPISQWHSVLLIGGK